MTELTRKQREIQDRDDLILKVSRELFIERGYHNVTMDMIAQEVEYSKGTIYQHYNNKEQIISKLCLRFSQLLLDLFSYVNNSDCPQYLKMHMLLETELVIHKQAKSDHALVNLVKAEAFMTKLDEDSVYEMNCHVEMILGQVLNIVSQAIEEGELTLAPAASTMSIALGCWALIEGTFDIADKHANEEASLKAAQLDNVLRSNCLIFLKGSGWHSMPIDASGHLDLNDEDSQTLTMFSDYCHKQIQNYYSS